VAHRRRIGAMAARHGQVIVPDQEAGRGIIMRAITGSPVMTMARRGAGRHRRVVVPTRRGGV
jgi:hypothetical protein